VIHEIEGLYEYTVHIGADAAHFLAPTILYLLENSIGPSDKCYDIGNLFQYIPIIRVASQLHNVV
jgi:hypothetical protein